MQPLKKQYSQEKHIVSITILMSCILLSLFLWNLDVPSISHAQTRIPSITATPTPSPISLFINSPSPGSLFVAPANILVETSVSDTVAVITSVKLTDVLAPGPVDSRTLGTVPTSTPPITPSIAAHTQSHQVTTHIGAKPFTTPPPPATCDDPVTTPCVATTFPYNFKITNVLAGRHVFVVTAVDSNGNTATASVYVPVTGTQPIVTIVTPSANATFTAPAQITLTTSVFQFFGTGLSILYFDGTKFIGAADTAPYTFIWTDAAVGTHILTAIASTGQGIIGNRSAPITIMVNPPGPPPCQVQYQVHQWPGGFSNNVTITNTGTTTLTAWNLQFAFGGDQRITNLWNGSFTQSGQQVTITNLSYNGTIAPQGTTNLGFNGTWNTSNTSPTSFTLNGQSCTIM